MSFLNQQIFARFRLNYYFRGSSILLELWDYESFVTYLSYYFNSYEVNYFNSVLVSHAKLVLHFTMTKPNEFISFDYYSKKLYLNSASCCLISYATFIFYFLLALLNFYFTK